MKVFAENLCLNMTEVDDYPSYAYPLLDWTGFLLALEQSEPFHGQTFHVLAESESSFVKELFEFQKIDTWRAKNMVVEFRFKNRTELGEFWSNFSSLFDKREIVAGGLVQNERAEYLFIYNRGKWTLPKGHVEKDEDVQTTAIREVQEETGLLEMEILFPLSQTYHTFLKKGKWRFKTTHWFKMSANSEQLLIPQLAENIEAAAWISKEDWIEKRLETYPLTQDLLLQEFVQNDL